MKVKGAVLLSRIAFVKEHHGDARWEEVLKALSESDRSTLHFLTAAGWYPFDIQERLEETIVTVVGRGDAKIFEQMGAVSAQKNLSTVHRHFLEAGNPQAFLAKAPSIYKFYYDKGRREYVSTGPTSGTLTTYGSDTPSKHDCLSVIGWHKQALTMCGAKNVSMIEDRCIANGHDCCRYQVNWAM